MAKILSIDIQNITKNTVQCLRIKATMSGNQPGSSARAGRNLFGGGDGDTQDRISLCTPCGPGTHSVDQVGLKLRDPSASAP